MQIRMETESSKLVHSMWILGDTGGEPIEVKTNTKGYTLIELITVMAILGILGTVLVSIMSSGGHFYKNTNEVMDAQSNVRLATSYLTVKIRQNDISNGIAVDDSSYAVPVLAIKDAGNPGYTFWIYFDSGKLREQYRNDVTGFDDMSLGSGEEIADISNFSTYKYSFDPSGNQIIDNTLGTNIQFEVKSADGTVDMNQNLRLRSPYF